MGEGREEMQIEGEAPQNRRCELGGGGGNIFGLLGTNGCGKSTLFKMMLGLEPISSGNIFIGGMSTESRIEEIRRLSGYCPQDNCVPPELSVERILRVFAQVLNEY